MTNGDGTIAIIGGGIQGLSTAVNLVKQGVNGNRICIFEQNPFLAQVKQINQQQC
jgi:glycine/D-amino acid oxidase-like deaminating enzyme